MLLGILARRRRLTPSRAALTLAFCVYLAGIVANTIFPIFLDKPHSSAPWTGHLALVPFVDYEVADAVMNIAVFLPLGMMLPLLAARPRWWRAVAVATAVSLGIETTQYVTAHLLGGGHLADVNDLIFNVLGGALGYLLLAGLVRVPGIGGVVDRFRWHDAPAPDAAPAAEQVLPPGGRP
jgi:glycopeptide antibiotics resistance protein